MSAVTATPPAPTPKVIVTPEDLLRMGDEGKRYELVGGKLEELNMSFLSSYVAGKMYKALDRYVEAGHPGWVVPEGTSFQCFPDDKGKVRRPDTALIALERLTVRQAQTEGHCPIAPDLAVQVISPNDYAKLVNQKVAEWLGAGVRLVWVIDPDAQTVYAYRTDRPNTSDVWRAADTLTGEPVLPGFAVPVADLFRLPAVGPAAEPPK
jgi:Uma2 family endonuclease